MVSAAFKHVPQPATTTFAFPYVWFFFYVLLPSIVGGKLVESGSLNYMESDTMWINPKSTNSQQQQVVRVEWLTTFLIFSKFETLLPIS